MLSSSCRTVLSQKDNKSKMDTKMLMVSKENVMSGPLTDIGLDSDLLRFQIKILKESYESEQARLTSLKEKEIFDLKAKNEELNVKIGDQADKIHQLDHSNIKKDGKIGAMIKRLEELLRQNDKLDKEISDMRELYERSTKENASQSQKIQKLELDLVEVRKELKSILEQKELQEKMFEKYIKDAREGQEKQNEKMQQLVKETMKEQFAEFLSKMEQQKDTPATTRGPEFHIKEVHSVQIALDSDRGKNIVEQPPKISTNRQVLKPSKCSIGFPK